MRFWIFRLRPRTFPLAFLASAAILIEIALLVIGYGTGSIANLGTNSTVAAVYLIAYTLAVIVGVGFAGAYVNARRMRASAARLEEKLTHILQRLDHVYHARTGLSSYLLKHQLREEEIEACVRAASDFLQMLVNEACAMFDEYTSQSCAVSVKLIVPSESGAPRIRTYLRDTRSFLERRGLYARDGTYPFGDHSPFVQIVSERGARDFFLSNDLRLDEREGRYQNGNPHWRRLYNATLIAPIKQPGLGSASEGMLGFLCVDSIDATFDKKACLHLARILANTVYYVVYSIIELEKRRSESTDQPPVAEARQ